MTVLTIPQCAGAWLGANGPRSRMVEFVAISMAESSLNDEAVSPAGAEGLWQVMPFWFPDLGLPADQWADPHVNAEAAVAISGHGSNCAAWDTCYRNILVSGRYTFLAFPESGSAAYNNIPQVAAVLGVNPPVPPPGGGGNPGSYNPSIPRVANAWAAAGVVLTAYSDTYLTSMTLLTKRANTLLRQYKPAGPPPQGY